MCVAKLNEMYYNDNEEFVYSKEEVKRMYESDPNWCEISFKEWVENSYEFYTLKDYLADQVFNRMYWDIKDGLNVGNSIRYAMHDWASIREQLKRDYGIEPWDFEDWWQSICETQICNLRKEVI